MSGQARTPNPPLEVIEKKDADWLRAVGASLQDVLGSLLGSEGAKIQRPTDLARAWNLDQTLCTRLFQALREPNPLIVLQLVPAPNALRAVLDVARDDKGASAHVARFGEAIDELDALISHLGGSKSTLDTLVARRFHHSRQKVEHTAKQAIYRGMSNLYGVQAEALVAAVFVFPGKDPGWCDELAVHGYHRLVRLRPERQLLIAARETLHEEQDPMSVVLCSLHGDTIEANGCMTALKRFSTSPLPELDIREERSKLLYALKEESDALPEEIDLFFASIERRGEPLHATETQERARYAVVPQNPCKYLVFDLYIHQDVWPGIEPQLHLLRQGDPTSPDLSAHSLDKLDFVESLQSLGTSSDSISSPHYPRYADLVHQMHKDMDWSLSSFRVYRCSVKYPVVGLWHSIQFSLPHQAR